MKAVELIHINIAFTECHPSAVECTCVMSMYYLSLSVDICMHLCVMSELYIEFMLECGNTNLSGVQRCNPHILVHSRRSVLVKCVRERVQYPDFIVITGVQ